MSNKTKEETPGKEKMPMFRISCVEIGSKKLEDIVFAADEQFALRKAYLKWPSRDTKPFRTDWKAEFVGMGEDHANQGAEDVRQGRSGAGKGVDESNSQGVSEEAQTP